MALLLFCMQTEAQRFFNLTATEVEVDTMLPHFGYSVPLEGRYQDSVYTVSIVYPDFVDMTIADITNYNRLSGAMLPELPVLTQRIVTDRKRASLEVSFCPLVFRNHRYQALAGFMLKVEAKALTRSMHRSQVLTRTGAAGARYADNSVLATGRWAKIRVPATGVYQLSEALIRKAGFTDLSKVKIYGYGGHLQNEKLTEADLIAYDDLKELATCTVNGRRLFYAKGPVSWASAGDVTRIRNPYSDYGYYFLTQTDGAPLTVDADAFLQSFYPGNDDYHVLHEVDNFAWFQGGRNLFEDTPIAKGTSKTYTLASAARNSTGKVSVVLSAGMAGSASIKVNGREVGQINIVLSQYDKGNAAGKTFQVDNLSANNEVEITTIKGGPIRLDYIQLTLSEPKPAPDLAAATFPVPEYVHTITNQNLHADGPADMVIIIPTSQKLLSQAQRLKAFREKNDGLRVRIIPSDELFNEFSSGTPDANAYRRYLKMLYDRADTDADMPRYLLLFGDCAWDNRMNTSEWRQARTEDYLLCFESENSFNEVLCYVDDGFFGLLDDGEGVAPDKSDKLDLAVGRFPVTTEEEAKILVDKTISYALNDQAGAWQNTLVFMGDDGNNNLHMTDLNDAAEDVAVRYPGYVIKKIMWDTFKRESSSTGYTYPDVTIAIKQYQASGALIMDYAGHGRADQISHEAVLKLNDFKNFSNKRLPLWITASCDIMPFDGTIPTIGETALLNKNGGAVAFFGTTRTVYAYYNKKINMTYLRYVLSKINGKPVTIGEAQRLAKNLMITGGQDLTENKLQYSLLGDPALTLNMPTERVVIDSINGIPVGSSSGRASLKAGSLVRVQGHIDGHEGFNGVVSGTVRDKKERIVCRLNDTSDEGAERPFTYTDRTKILYNGSDSVKNGRFSFLFAVPKDIDYESGTGLMNVYAVNNDHTIAANGYSESFTVGGSDIAGNDSIGPSIFCYLNSPEFTDGGSVNARPYFVAKITDKDGLNTTGSGVGHDLQLTIDGDMSKTYSLNDYFVYDFGSYTKGSVGFSIPLLSEGQHTLTFRAWDILNNSSTTSLNFHVVEGMGAGDVNIIATDNPAVTSTTFIVTHNMGNAPADVEIEVYDRSGRKLWTGVETGVTDMNGYTRSWDLMISGGGRLQPGIYFYRAKLTVQGSSKLSKARKLIVVDNK